MNNIISFRAKASQARFNDLVGPHLDHLYRLAFRFCSNRDDAEDLVQELVVKLYSNPKELTAIENLRPWLARALYNLYVDNFRRFRRAPVSFQDDEQIPEVPDEGNQPDLDHERAQRRQRLQQMFDQLSEEHRRVLALHDMEGYSLPELAEIMDVPVGTLKSRLHRARDRLRELLQKDGTF